MLVSMTSRFISAEDFGQEFSMTSSSSRLLFAIIKASSSSLAENFSVVSGSIMSPFLSPSAKDKCML